MDQSEKREQCRMDNTCQSLKLFYTNCRSAKGKSTELSSLTVNYDVICLTETHVDDTITDRSIINRDDLVFFRKDRNICGGGVLVAADRSLFPREIKAPECKAEAIFVRINECIVLCCYYRPHQSCEINNFIETFNNISSKYPKDEIILLGDLNFPGFDWQTGQFKSGVTYKALHESFLSFLFENSLTQIIQTSTHIKGNTLDLICTNNPATVSTNVVYPGLSDHYIIDAQLRYFNSRSLTETRKLRLYHKADIDVFQEHLWPTQCKLAEMNDVYEMWDLFSSELKRAVDKSVPIKSICSKPTSQPRWFNKRARKLVTKHRQTYNKFKITNDPFYLNKYKQERRHHRAELRQIEQDYITNRVCKPLEDGNSKPFYQHLKWSQGVTKPPMKLNVSNSTKSQTEDPKECANILNDYFSTQFCKQYQLDGNNTYNCDSSSNVKIAVEGVSKLINALKNGKSSGPDEIRKEDLIIDPIMTSKCLTYIFQASLNSSKLPNGWKLAYVTPIHKRGSTDQPNNYRPISLTSIPCKIMEHIVLHHLNLILDQILFNRQHGFRKGLSCETQLCGTYHEIVKHADHGDCIHAVVLDFAKAFDKVPHKLLMQKLSNIPNMTNELLMWIHDFLLDRKQKVRIKGNLSSELSVTSGVPQGSVLGPTLFLAYINDLPNNINCKISLFADDTLIYQVVNNNQDHERFQKNITALQNWSQDWCMSFNIDKCSVLAFNSTSTSPSAEYYLNDTSLEIVQETKYLGVILQSDLKFTKHIQVKVGKAKRQLGMIKRALFDAPEKARLLAYTSLCRPHVEYAASVWDTSLEYLIHDIEMVQNSAIRFISKLKGRESITMARENLQIETLAERRTKIRHSLLLRLLSKEENHNTLISSYDELMNERSSNIAVTRAAARSEPPTIYAKKNIYHNSFLPKTVRELKLKLQPTI